MTRFFDPQKAEDPHEADRRLYAPATARNRDVILEVLKTYATPSGTLLELASGSGEHAAYMAPKLPDITWQPSDIEDEKLASIDAWRTATDTGNILPAARLDVLKQDFSDLELPAPLTTVMSANLIHIAPWQVAEALIEKAGKALETSGLLFLYGPFKHGGMHTAPSNESFDISLKSRDASWGVRDLEEVVALAEKAGFATPEIIDMPANNLSVIFRRN